MKKTNQKITRFEDGDFYIDIVESESDFEAWITEKEYGLSALMFGVPRKQADADDVSFTSFCELIESNLDDHKANYIAFVGE